MNLREEKTETLLLFIVHHFIVSLLFVACNRFLFIASMGHAGCLYKTKRKKCVLWRVIVILSVVSWVTQENFIKSVDGIFFSNRLYKKYMSTSKDCSKSMLQRACFFFLIPYNFFPNLLIRMNFRRLNHFWKVHRHFIPICNIHALCYSQ